MNKLMTISEASRELGVSVSTLRRWDKSGQLAAEKTASGHKQVENHTLHSAERFAVLVPHGFKIFLIKRVSRAA